MRYIAMILVLVCCAGCYRTTYRNVSPETDALKKLKSAEKVAASNSWQSFFIYGWVPSERVINVSETCKGALNVDEIQTRRTFGQGLVAAFANYYINIYSPFDGAVLCKNVAFSGR